MDYKRFGNSIIVRLDKNEEILEQLRILAQRENICLASVQGLGAVDELTLGAYDVQTKSYIANEFHGVYEISSLVGTIDSMDGAFYTHIHVTAADTQGRAYGGHLSRGIISATGELVITVIDGRLDRKFHDDVGLNLLHF